MNLVRINSHQEKDGSEQVVNAVRLSGRVTCRFVACSDNNASFDSATGKNDGLTGGPVIATGIIVDSWSSPHLSHHDDQCLIQHSAIIKICQQSTEGTICWWTQGLFMAGEIVKVCIPAAVVDCDKTAPRFDE